MTNFNSINPRTIDNRAKPMKRGAITTDDFQPAMDWIALIDERWDIRLFDWALCKIGDELIEEFHAAHIRHPDWSGSQLTEHFDSIHGAGNFLSPTWQVFAARLDRMQEEFGIAEAA